MSLLMKLQGYLRSLRQYLATSKGAFDARDYLKAAGLMLLSMAALAFVVKLFLGE